MTGRTKKAEPHLRLRPRTLYAGNALGQDAKTDKAVRTAPPVGRRGEGEGRERGDTTSCGPCRADHDALAGAGEGQIPVCEEEEEEGGGDEERFIQRQRNERGGPRARPRYA